MGWLAIYGPSPEQLAETEAVPPAEAVCDQDVDEENEPVEGPEIEPPKEHRSVNIAVPQAEIDFTGCYVSCHVDVRLSQLQGKTLRRLCLALDERNTKLKNGRRVVTAADAVRWLLEQLEHIGVD